MTTRMTVQVSSPTVDLGAFNVSVFTIRDALNACFELTLELRSRRDTPPEALDIAQAVGAEATLDLTNDQGTQSFTGLIAEAAHIGMTGEHVQTWRLELVSPVWQLGLGRRHANHRDQKTDDLVKQALGLYGMHGDLDSTTYRAKATLQHGESDLDFIARLLAEEGQVWITACDQGRATFFSAGNHQRLCTDARAVSGRFDPHVSNHSGLADGLDAGGAILTFHCTRRTTFSSSMVAASTVRNAETPTISQKEVAAAGIKTVAKSVLLRTDHHGGHRDAQDSMQGRKVGAWIAERAKALATLAQGTSDIHRLCAGGSLKLNGHQDERCNIKWVITEVEHTFRDPLDGSLPVYRNRFSCVPFDGPLLRPELREPPRVAGLRLGIVTDCNLPADGWDEPGTTSDTGLYAVKFPGEPDSDGNPILQHMRLAHPWAGKDRGFHFPLEVGDEVVVAHEHGDPARPFILGSLHSAVNKGPSVNTADGLSTSGVLRSRTGHELRYDDDSGQERILIKSGTGDHQIELHDADEEIALTTAGDLIESVEGNRTTSIGGDRGEEVAGETEITIGKSLDLKVGAEARVTIGDKESRSVGKDRTTTIGGGETISVGKDFALDIGAKGSVTITGNTSFSTDGSFSAAVAKDAALTVSGGFATDVTKSVSVKAKKLTVEAEDEISLICGQAKLILKKNGDITIDGGGKVNLKAGSDIILKGSKIGAN